MWKQIRLFFKDLKHVGALGFGYPARHIASLFGERVATIHVPGFGPFAVRYGDSDAAVLRQVFARREYDLSKLPQQARIERRYNALIAAGRTPVIIDAGANIGCASAWFAKHFPKAAIVAIEPDEGNVAIAKRNIAAYQTVKLVEGAIGASSGRVDVVSGDGQSFGIRTERSDEGSVKVYSVGDLKREAGPGAELLLVKVDIEGFEKDLFSENLDWLDETTALIVEPHDWMLPGQHSSGTLQRAVFPRNFEMLIHRESLVFVR